jgi:acetyltransferase-like isoleucine patch superfamily enzyme
MDENNNIISENIRLRHPNHFQLGKNNIVDDFCYFSTKIRIGNYSHIANNVSIGGGLDYEFILGDYSSLSSGVRIWCSSNNFINDIGSFSCEHLFDDKIAGNVEISNLCIVGSNTVVMPDNYLPIGVTIGALSFVPINFPFESWSLYAGIPIKFIKKRDKNQILNKYNLLKDNE